MILLIDTSGDLATVALSLDGERLGMAENNGAKEHAAWLHPAVRQLLRETGQDMSALQAVAVMAGPGSYTGLRVGMAAAKGICFTRNIPLIACGSLPVIATAMIPFMADKSALLCPMIDARRAEVFTALYSRELWPIMPPGPVILDKNSFEEILKEKIVLFAGSGAVKWSKIVASPNAVFPFQLPVIDAFMTMATADFRAGRWADTVYAEPGYGKDFQTHVEF